MAVAVHSNVGLFHATMAIFNAWCDRMPVLILGATGPVDAAKRRPWIDWIHTARDQGAIVRRYVKWDDQPASPGGRARGAAARDVACAVPRRRARSTSTSTREMQEAPLAAPLPPIDAGALPAGDAASRRRRRRVARSGGAAARRASVR